MEKIIEEFSQWWKDEIRYSNDMRLPSRMYFCEARGTNYGEENALTLLLKKQWFDLINSGIKTEEYREIKPYWEKRLNNKSYNIVEFRNGYNKDAPKMTFKINEIIIGKGCTEWGAVPNKTYYVIRLGERIN